MSELQSVYYFSWRDNMPVNIVIILNLYIFLFTWTKKPEMMPTAIYSLKS